MSRCRTNVRGTELARLRQILASTPDVDRPDAEEALDTGIHLSNGNESYELDLHSGRIVRITPLKVWMVPDLIRIAHAVERDAVVQLRQRVDLNDAASRMRERLSGSTVTQLLDMAAGMAPLASDAEYYACDGYGMIQAELRSRGETTHSVLSAHLSDRRPVQTTVHPRETIAQMCRRLLGGPEQAGPR